MRKNILKFQRARRLRRAGWSYNEIIKKVGVRKSTLHYWLRDVVLSTKQRLRLRKQWEEGLKKARVFAAEYHRRQKRERFAHARIKAEDDLLKIKKVFFQKSLLRFFLSVLHLGEGAKKISAVQLGNSDPDICKIFVALLRMTFSIDESRFRCHLHLRLDQNAKREVKYWSTLLRIPPQQFMKSHFDKRTKGKRTYGHYHGVCAVYYYDAEIQKYILNLGKVFLETLLGGS